MQSGVEEEDVRKIEALVTSFHYAANAETASPFDSYKAVLECFFEKESVERVISECRRFDDEISQKKANIVDEVVLSGNKFDEKDKKSRDVFAILLRLELSISRNRKNTQGDNLTFWGVSSQNKRNSKKYY